MKIAKDDPRVAALVFADDSELTGAALRRFIVPGRGGTVDVFVTAADELDLQPERSASHKALCAMLGVA